MSETVPADQTVDQRETDFIAASVHDTGTGALFVHKDLVQVRDDWEVPPTPPINTTESFGDVESWVAYVKRFSVEDALYLSWSADGLRAVLDYHTQDNDPGRCQWLATAPFVKSTEWTEWAAFANGQTIDQKRAVEKLEELADDVVEPIGADLLGLLRSLRASASANAQTTLNADGTTSVTFASDQSVRTASMKPGELLELPPTLSIAIPVLKGDVDRFKLTVRLRVSVDASAHLNLRFTIQNAERVLEQVYAERVAKAQALLGEAFAILRGA